MKRALGYLFIFSLFTNSILATSAVSATSSSPDTWAGPIQTKVIRDLSPSEVQNRPDCVYGSARKKNLAQPFEYLLGSIPVLKNLIYEDLGQQCLIQNDQGLFTSTYTKSLHYIAQSSNHYGNDANSMFGINIGAYNHLDPSPAGDVVMLQGRPTYFDKTYYAILHRNMSKGTPSISGTNLVWGFNDSSAEKLKYVNGTEIRLSAHAFSANGKYLVFQTNNNTNIVNLETMSLTPVLTDGSTTGGALAVSNDGKYVAVLRNGLHIINTENCALIFPKGQWSTPTSTALNGCIRIQNRLPEINSAFTSSNYYLRPYFDATGAKLRLSAGTRIAGISPNASGPTAYTWSELEISATNYVSNTEGYLAMGDSFSSGEGDLFGGTWYEPGTDEQGNKETFEDRNLCHLSRRSYPYLIAKELGFLSGDASEPTTPEDSGLFHSVACSGAVLHNIIGGANNGTVDYAANEKFFSDANNQFRNDYLSSLGRWQPGRLKQLDILDPTIFGGYSALEHKPSAITVGISGNDAGFGDTIKACTMPGTCKQAVAGSFDLSSLALRIMRLKPKLVETYKSVKSASPESRVYVHGYPIFVQGYNGTCDANVRLDSQETVMVEEGIKYMNKIVQSAASEAGVFYIDIENILEGSNLCSGVIDSGKENGRTVNGVTAGNDVDFKICILRSGCLGKESFHPNQFAHKLYKVRVLQTTGNLTYDMPNAQKTTTPVPDSYFGPVALSEVSAINNGGSYTIVIPESKPFLSNNSGNIKINQPGLMPGSLLRVELQSTPVKIAEITVPSSGKIDTNVTLPSGTESGSHELHLLGISNFGELIDYYEPIVVAVSETDFDGDGVMNSDDSCPATFNIFVDIDIDEIDDTCDPTAVGSIVIVETPLVIDPPMDTPPEENNLDGRNLDKGQPNPETVAGDEDLPQVLGVATVDTTVENESQRVLGVADTLEVTGYAMILNIIVGTITIFIAILLFRHRRD